MAENMRQELNDVKAAVSALGVQVNALHTDVSTLKTDVSTLKTDVSALKTDVSALQTDVSALKTDVSALKTDVAEVKTLARNTAIIVAGHTEAFVRIEQRLTKLDELDGLKKCLEVFTAEIIASRHERALSGKTFFDQQATLTDHELRLTRIELRGKQS